MCLVREKRYDISKTNWILAGCIFYSDFGTLAAAINLVAIYCCGGGQDGLIRALRDENASQRIVAVCNELTSTTRAALIDGTIDLVLAHPIQQLATKTVELMIKTCVTAELPNLPPTLFAADIFMSENI